MEGKASHVCEPFSTFVLNEIRKQGVMVSPIGIAVT